MNCTEAVFFSVGGDPYMSLQMLHAHGLISDPRGPPTHGSCAGMLRPARAQQMEARAVECGVNADR